MRYSLHVAHTLLTRSAGPLHSFHPIQTRSAQSHDAHMACPRFNNHNPTTRHQTLITMDGKRLTVIPLKDTHPWAMPAPTQTSKTTAST